MRTRKISEDNPKLYDMFKGIHILSARVNYTLFPANSDILVADYDRERFCYIYKQMNILGLDILKNLDIKYQAYNVVPNIHYAFITLCGEKFTNTIVNKNYVVYNILEVTPYKPIG